MKILFVSIICVGSALFGQLVVGDIPVANWFCGVLAGIVSLTIWSID